MFRSKFQRSNKTFIFYLIFIFVKIIRAWYLFLSEQNLFKSIYPNI